MSPFVLRKPFVWPPPDRKDAPQCPVYPPFEDWDLVLLGCGQAKAKGKRAAIELYTGSVFKAHLAILTHLRESPHYILSAKHRLLQPAITVAPYDATLSDASQRAAWNESIIEFFTEYMVEHEQAPLYGGRSHRLLVLAGATYVDGWADQVRELGITVDDPLRGMTLGERRAFAGWFVTNEPKRTLCDALGPKPMQLAGAVARFKATSAPSSAKQPPAGVNVGGDLVPGRWLPCAEFYDRFDLTG